MKTKTKMMRTCKSLALSGKNTGKNTGKNNGELTMIGSFCKAVMCGTAMVGGLMASGSSLGSDNTGKIEYIAVGSPIAYVKLVNSTGQPACAQQLGRYAIYLDNNTGKSMYAMALTAQATGRNMRIIGSGNCTLASQDSEDVLNTVIPQQ